MGKNTTTSATPAAPAKQIKAKKFDRNVEISAPILDPEVVKAIHSPPKDKKLDIRHGGFKALLSDLNSQDSTDDMVPIFAENHLPSYIGISCAVSGYSNYSSYNRRPLDDITTSNGGDNELKSARLAASSRLSSATPNRSHTSSPLSKQRTEQQNINHVTIDKTTISSPDQERKELTEKLTASLTERRRSPSPLPPVEDGRHHGAHVVARYFPMPEPSKLVHKHIPLLGIDDDQDPDEYVPENTNKVEKQIANLYGEEFVENWKESMSHKTKKELQEEAEKVSSKNLKDLVTLKPTPSKAPEPVGEEVEVAMPDIKVLAGVEKQFLNRLLTDENPPMPKSPSPQPMSPDSPRMTRPIVSPVKTNFVANCNNESPPETSPAPPRTPTPPPPQTLLTKHRSPTPEPSPEPSPVASPVASPLPPVIETRDELVETTQDSPVTSPIPDLSSESPIQEQLDSLINVSEPELEVGVNGPEDEIITLDEQLNVELHDQHNLISSPVDGPSMSPNSPDSEKSNTTVEEVKMPAGEQHIEYEIRTQSPVNNESSPVKMLDQELKVEQSYDFTETLNKETGDLVSFSPEPTEPSLNNNNYDNAPNNPEDQIDLIESDETAQTRDSLGTIERIAVDVSPKSEISQEIERTGDNLSSSIKDGRYFLSILEQEESFIMEQVKLAEMKLAEHELEWSEEQIGRVRSAIGKGQLLVNKKCNQFRELCEKSLTNDANEQYAVLNDDLAGFWDMISIQIADVRRSFENLYN